MAVPGGYGQGGGYTGTPQIRFDAIGDAWRLLQAQMSTWIVAQLLMLVVVGITYFVAIFVFGIILAATFGLLSKTPLGFFAFPLAIFVPLAIILSVMFILMGGMYRMAIRQMRGDTIQVGDLFATADIIGPLAVGSILMSLFIGIGVIFCYVPGLIVAGLLMFTIPLIVDRGMAPMDAIRLSYETLKSQMLMATVFLIVVQFVAGLGAIACGIGALVTYPLYFLSIAVLYRDFFLGGALPPASPYYQNPTPPPGDYPPPPPPVG
jgi:hypothetical protein